MDKASFQSKDFLLIAKVVLRDPQKFKTTTRAYKEKASLATPLTDTTIHEDTLLYGEPHKNRPINLDNYNHLVFNHLAWSRPARHHVVYEDDNLRKKDALLVSTEDATKTVLLVDHEHSGAEFFIMPVLAFIGSAILTGIIGNLAYASLKELHERAVDALKDYGKRNGLQEEQIDDYVAELADDIVITISTTDKKFSVKFDGKKGLSKDISEDLVRRIQNYTASDGK